jgi:hypothetical protein
VHYLASISPRAQHTPGSAAGTSCPGSYRSSRCCAQRRASRRCWQPSWQSWRLRGRPSCSQPQSTWRTGEHQGRCETVRGNGRSKPCLWRPYRLRSTTRNTGQACDETLCGCVSGHD